jgi:Tfp pilus assembly protein PilO
MNRRAPLIVALVVIAIAIAVFFLLVFPKMKQVGRAQDDLETARDEQVTLETELARLQAVREDAPKIRRQVARFRKEVPPVADLPGMINQLQDAADVSNVDFFAVSPGTPAAATAGAAAVIPAQIQVIGGFFQVDEFLFRLETLPRAAKVVTVAITEGPDQLPQIQVTMSVEFYTTDTSAGPGAAIDTAPEPGTSPAPGASPEPSPSPAEGA